MRIRKPRKKFGHNSQAGGTMPFGLDPDDLNRSIEQCWSEHWEAQGLARRYGERIYNPASRSNPRAEKWFYPNKSVKVFRAWVQHEYYAGGKFEAYLNEKVERGEIPPALAAQALTTILRGARMGSA